MSNLSERQIILTRLIQAPRELVFKAFTDPEHISEWYGPSGFSITTHKMEPRPGGVWLFMMHGPDGTNYPNSISYREIVAPERIVFDHGDDQNPSMFHVIVTFEDKGGQTQITMNMLFPTKEERDQVAGFGAIELGQETLTKLAAYVTGDFILIRAFKAPRELVFKAFTDPECISQWCTPFGCTMPVRKLDRLAEGGVFHYCQVMPNGNAMWGRWIYREVVPPQRIVTVTSFSDEAGGVTTHPMAPTWPREMLSTITLTQHPGVTVATMTSKPWNATEEERKTFDTGRKGFSAGWGNVLDQLDQFLVKQS